ncbi:MAG: 6,7-dimethyl-8-ribityllumazine synthase [Actinomycetota bacterium]|jgi:6,7-dimethyl-8-ribityllumazine synthase|nr:6,7-dimethyl-8-ribityllumazine synthase [Actinomycetota bacterium]
MTSSDATILADGAVDAIAARVGTSIVGGDSGSGIAVGIACAAFNGGITHRLLSGALDRLEASGVDLTDVTVAWVPGAFELPVACRAMARSGAYDAVIAFGAVIRGDTGHYEFVAGECASGLQRVQLDTGVPTIFGVLTTETVGQALERSEPDATNKGSEAAITAIETVHVVRALGGGR